MQPAFFLAENDERNGLAIVVAFKDLFTLGAGAFTICTENPVGMECS